MADARLAPQLALAFPHDGHPSDADLLPHPGIALALDFLARPAAWPGRRLILWGEPCAGKTHLLRLWARDHGATVVLGPALAEPFWPEGAVAIDDADRAASEEALLHLLNAAGEDRRPLLMTATQPPARLQVRLPDLASRLRAVTAVELGRADDRFRAGLFARLLARRQLVVTEALQSWILQRLPRRQTVICETVARLDDAALAAKAPVTRALAAAALVGLLDEPTPELSR